MTNTSRQVSNIFNKHLKEKSITLSNGLNRFFNSNFTNGSDHKKQFNDVYESYKNQHLVTLSESSRVGKVRRCDRFLVPLLAIKMIDMTPQLIGEFIIFSKNNHVDTASKKYNFDKQIKDLTSIFNWYTDHVDFKFRNPVRRYHLKLGVIEDVPEKERQIEIYEYKGFLNSLPSFFKDMATMQFFCAGRIGEIAGIHRSNIDLDKKILTIKEVLVWIKGVPKVKSCPKNGNSRVVFINETMEEIIKRHFKNKCEGIPFLFHKRGQALRYNNINENYNKAWKDAGLSHKFSGTHLVRYAAAQIARKVSGSLDAAKSITGHKSNAMAEKYSNYVDIELNKNTLIDIETHLGLQMT
jgi:integrase